MKYKTLQEVWQAYASGEIPADCPLIVDSGDCYLYLCDGKTLVYSGPTPQELAMEALTLLGIPYEPA